MASENITRSGVLIIDPQAHMAALIAEMLRALGRRDIREVQDANQARLELRRRPFGLVIIDDSLVAPDAVDLVGRLRTEPDGHNRLTPVIMMSAAPDVARIKAARDAGVTEFLRKPFAARDIKSRLDSIAASPRPFIEAQSYAGPDRRRKIVGTGKAERRAPSDSVEP
jgi:two-component system chemotaxis response regulator CheY